MRTLRRVEHVRPPGPRQLADIERKEERTRRVRELFAWWRLVATFASLGAVATLVYWILGLRRVEDGLVEAQSVRYEAPADVRVAEVLCQVGLEVQRGDPLLRLEPRRPSEDRVALEIAVEQARLRLALAEAGGELGDMNLSRRAELLDQAQREERLAREQVGVVGADLERLQRERAALEVVLAQQGSEREGTAQSLGARTESVLARADGARAGRDLAVWDAERGERLAEMGVASDRARVSTALEREASEHDIADLEAAARALELESNAAARVAELEQARGETSLAAQDAAIEAARRRVEANAAALELWGRTREQRAALVEGGAVDPAALRALELELRRAELGAAEGHLAAFDAAAGELVVRAELDGVIEWLAVEQGSVVERGTELVRYFDPATLAVVVYMTPDAARGIAPGASCRLMPSDQDSAIDGRVVSVGGGWVPCPDALPKRTEAYVDLRLPVRVLCGELERRRLRPNLMVKVRFPYGEEEEVPDP